MFGFLVVLFVPYFRLGPCLASSLCYPSHPVSPCAVCPVDTVPCTTPPTRHPSPGYSYNFPHDQSHPRTKIKPWPGQPSGGAAAPSKVLHPPNRFPCNPKVTRSIPSDPVYRNLSFPVASPRGLHTPGVRNMGGGPSRDDTKRTAPSDAMGAGMGLSRLEDPNDTGSA